MTDEKKTDEGTEAPAAAATPEEKAKATKAKTKASAPESRPVRAVAKYLRFSAQKGRIVVDQIRGKKVLDAATALAFGERHAAREVMKVLKSAVANAENNHGMSAEELYVSAAFVDEGPTFKRWKPRARGRVDRINKRTCHITVIVDNAPAELLEGRGGTSAKPSASRSARVAGSKAAADKAPAKKAPAKKPAAKKPAADKPAAKKTEDAPKPAEAEAVAAETTDAADAATTEGEA
jgi:large subunit ribosomal protein L22